MPAAVQGSGSFKEQQCGREHGATSHHHCTWMRSSVPQFSVPFNKSTLDYGSLTDTSEAINCPSGISISLLPRSVLCVPITDKLPSSLCVPSSPLCLQWAHFLLKWLCVPVHSVENRILGAPSFLRCCLCFRLSRSWVGWAMSQRCRRNATTATLASPRSTRGPVRSRDW